MAEQHTLTTPVTRASVTTYSVQAITFDWANVVIVVSVLASSGDVIRQEYRGPTATTLMVALNKVDLSVKSLQKRVLERLVADGVLGAGAVTGTPD